ncbi:MAG: CPBP family intramembrane metalloprotease [Candidatus Kuenenia sp.]|nr:CPBP family intramembrane metalloprotease [Candidatus Kuenenia hertensis]
MSNTRTKQNISLECRWSLKDAIKVFIAYLVFTYAGMPILVRFIQTIFGFEIQITSPSFRTLILFVSLLVNLIICLYICYIVRFEYRQSIVNLGLTLVNLTSNIKIGLIRYLITIPVIMLAGFIVNAVSSYYGIMPDIQDVVQWVLDEDSVLVLACLIFFGIIVAPIMEEIIFRGFLVPALRNYFGVRYAIFISAAVFAAVHMDAFAFLQIFILGILLGYLYEKTQSLATSIVVHILHNSLTLAFLMYFKFFLDGKVPVF